MQLIYIFLLYLIYYIWYTSKETFLVVGYNDSIIPNYTIKNLFDEETELLDSQFSSLSVDNNFDIKSFILFNNNIPFPFTSQFQKLLLVFLKTIPKINKNKISLGDFNNIYYKDDNKSIIFILNVNLQDNTTFTSRNIKVKFVINQNPNIISILSVRLDINKNEKFNTTGIDQLNLNPYFINMKNSNMIITKNIEQNFNKSLVQHNIKNILNYNSVGSNFS